ncbi:MAG: cytochrome d ubiquinol oxidase subunit II [Rhodospirillaceae bacterium]
MDYPLIFALIIAFGVFMYVFMDGFDLGVGILFPITGQTEEERDTMMNSVAPVWDGNETWLVLGGAALFGAFPLAYATILPALYLPLLIMLIALIFRGVAFEFRFKTVRAKHIWSIAFFGGSLVCTFTQGMVLGAYISGFLIEARGFVGGAFDWFGVFPMFTGLAVVAGYAALGCGWLIMKTEGDLQDRCFRLMPGLVAAVLIAIVAVSIWTPFVEPRIAERWFSLPNLFLLSPVPVAVALCAVFLFRALRQRRDVQPFVLTLALFALSFIGLGISLWPVVVPPDITIWDAAAPDESLSFLLVGVAILIPVILTYTAYTYYVFRGKVKAGEGYH